MNECKTTYLDIRGAEIGIDKEDGTPCSIGIGSDSGQPGVCKNGICMDETENEDCLKLSKSDRNLY